MEPMKGRLGTVRRLLQLTRQEMIVVWIENESGREKEKSVGLKYVYGA